MASGYVLIEINTEGNGRVKSPEGCPEVKYLDFRLEGCDFEHYEMADSMMGGLPKELKNVLVLCSFTIEGVESFNGESTEYDTEIRLESHIVLKTGYKEFYRMMITEELKLQGTAPDCDDGQYYENLLSDWEEFYGEDFKPFKKEPKKINGVIDLWGAIM